MPFPLFGPLSRLSLHLHVRLCVLFSHCGFKNAESGGRAKTVAEHSAFSTEECSLDDVDESRCQLIIDFKNGGGEKRNRDRNKRGTD